MVRSYTNVGDSRGQSVLWYKRGFVVVYIKMVMVSYEFKM